LGWVGDSISLRFASAASHAILLDAQAICHIARGQPKNGLPDISFSLVSAAAPCPPASRVLYNSELLKKQASLSALPVQILCSDATPSGVPRQLPHH
jgi:hypothetical protein